LDLKKIMIPEIGRAHGSFLLTLAVLATAMCLRLPFTAVAPLFEFIERDLVISPAAIGLLTTIPLLAFSIGAPVAAGLNARYGAQRCIAVALFVIAIAICLRSTSAVWAIYVATAMLGLAIAVANVLLPAVIKENYSDNIGSMTALYVLFMTAAAGSYSLVVVPIAANPAWGWQGALGIAAILPIVAGLLWIIRRQTAKSTLAMQPQATAALWTSPTAWAVTLYFGLAVFVHYAAIAWLPAILRDAGYSLVRAGALHGWMQFAGALPGLALILMLKRIKDQRLIAMLSPLLAALGWAVLIVWPDQAFVSAVLVGAGLGAGFVLGLAFMGLRAASAAQAASLSGMAQFIGYLLAAMAPVSLAWIYSSLQSWRPPLTFLLILTVVMAALGLAAGKPNHSSVQE
jgi:CP family cyanate transporter-like MFS transporter